MTRKVFYSFHYQPDSWRVSQVRNIGAIDDNPPAKDNDWETITNGGEVKIKEWINNQMKGRSCVVVLIGENTANRKWIDYEIERAWNEKKGLLGIHIHNLKNSKGLTCSKGSNPFAAFNIKKTDGRIIALSNIVQTYDPAGFDSKSVYQNIVNNLENWIEKAVQIRNEH